MAAPRLTAIGSDGKSVGGVIREMMPGALPDYFDGDQVIVLGQYTGTGKITLRMEGGVPGQAGREF